MLVKATFYFFVGVSLCFVVSSSLVDLMFLLESRKAVTPIPRHFEKVSVMDQKACLCIFRAGHFLTPPLINHTQSQGYPSDHLAPVDNVRSGNL